MSDDLDLEGFMGHSTGGGGGGAFLRGWRKRTPPVVHVWLHTKALFRPLWQHNIPQVRVLKDRQTGEERRVVWSQNFNCHEHEAVLTDRKRDQRGERERPFEVCPVCKLNEHVRRQVTAGKLAMTDVIFDFKASDEEGAEQRIIHAGGIYNGFGDDRLSDKEKIAIRQAGIKLTEAWRENANAKCNYLFLVVDDAHPEEGVQIALETSLLGDKMKNVLRQQKKKHGENGPWNPLLTPYAFAWEHHPSAKAFGDKYEAYDMPSLKLSPDIKRLIVDEDPPDIDRIKAPGKVRYLREQLERYATEALQVDWDDIFGEAEARQKDEDDKDAGSFDYGYNVADETDAKSAIAAGEKAFEGTTTTSVSVPAKVEPATAPAAQAPAQAPAAVVPPAAAAAPTRKKLAPAAPAFTPTFTPCDDCGAVMRDDEPECWNCHAKYGVEMTPEQTAGFASLGPVDPKTRVAPPPKA